MPADGSANAVGVPAVELEAGSEPIDAPPPSSAFFDGAAEASAALTPPVSVQGLALWLDGTAGLSANDPRGGIGTWADRSGFGHVFVGQEQPGCAGPPQPGWLNGRGAVSFVGVCSASGGAQNRLVSEPYPTSTQMDALTLDPLGFALAVVFQGQAAMDWASIVTPTPKLGIASRCGGFTSLGRSAVAASAKPFSTGPSHVYVRLAMWSRSN